jgi:hypothetical protein
VYKLSLRQAATNFGGGLVVRAKFVGTLAVVLGAFASLPSVGVAAGTPAMVATWNGTPQSTATGTMFQVALVAVVRDANTNGVQGVTVTFSAPAGSGPGATFGGSSTATAVTDSSGAAIAPTLTANAVSGSYTVVATVAGVSGSAMFNLSNTGNVSSSSPQAPAGLRFFVVSGTPSVVSASGGTPQSTVVNTGFAPLQASVVDAANNPMIGIPVTFAAPTTGASGLFGGATSTTVATNTFGVASASTLTANGTVGSYAVTATVAGVSSAATFSLANVAAGVAGGGGTWTNVTPAGITLDPNGTAAGPLNNYGVQGVHADPSRPGTFYASVTYQGLWKSTDYGLTWSKVTVTSGPNPMDNARPNIDVASDGTYIIGTALYPINGISNGAWKSTNGGQTWTRYTVGAANGDDMGRFAIHPTATNRVLGGPHSAPYHMFESRDGGQTWTDQGAPGGATAASLAWIDDNTVLAISDGDNGAGNGTWRGVRSGSVWPWSWTWTYVSTQQHWHGDTQIYIDPSTRAIFTGGGFGVQRSTDNGLTWTTVSSTNSSSIVGTGAYLYATGNYATGGSFGPYLMHAQRANGGASWVADTNPPAMNNGWLYAASGLQNSHYVVIGGNWLAGIWRMVEP